MLEPVRNLVMIEKIEGEKTTASGLIVGSDPTEAQQNTVLAVGPSVSDQVSVGDKIIVDYNKAWRTKYAGKEYLFIEEPNIICVVD